MSRATFTAVQSIGEFLALSGLERTALDKFSEPTESITDPLERMQHLFKEAGDLMASNQHPAFIIKAGLYSQPFKTFCSTAPFDAQWSILSCSQMLLLCGRLKLPTFNLEFKNSISPLDHMCGLYLCNESLKIAKRFTGDEFPSLAAGYLLHAVTAHRSIHALQHYNAYRYQEISKELAKPAPDFEKVKDSYMEMIADCKSMTKDYGSYAYMMLAEANTRMALFFSNKPDKTARECRQASHFFTQAIDNCREADKLIITSAPAITFASLNQGLGASNSFGFSEPTAAKIAIQGMEGGLLTEAEAKAGDHATRPATMPGV
ncbi:MAG: DUF5630 domain-containing protein [Coxiellaceae bacterium]|nr:DUF5630 domain-containing protein [Coxiellaceae bacterium]